MEGKFHNFKMSKYNLKKNHKIINYNTIFVFRFEYTGLSFSLLIFKKNIDYRDKFFESNKFIRR
jgi:hypothetical protein